MAQIVRLVSAPETVVVAATREEAVQAVIAGTGEAAAVVERAIIWPTLEAYVNDNSNFLSYEPAQVNPAFVWAAQAATPQTIGMAAATSIIRLPGQISYDLSIAVFVDNAHSLRIDVVDAATGTIVDAPPLGVLLLDGSLDPEAGTTIEAAFFPYNWQNIRYYSVTTPVLPEGIYKFIVSFTAVNYEQFSGLPNPAALAFVTDVFAPIPTNIIYNVTQATSFISFSEAVAAANAGDELLFFPGNYAQPTQVVIDKSLTLRGFGNTSPIITFGSDLLNGLRIEADNVTIDNLHFIGANIPTSTFLNAVIDMVLKTQFPTISLYENFTLTNSIIEGGERNVVIRGINTTITGNQFIHSTTGNSLELAVVQGTTLISDNSFSGGATSTRAIIIQPIEPGLISTGSIQVLNNTMLNYNQFLSVNATFDNASLLAEGNTINHGVRNGSSFTLLGSTNFSELSPLIIQNNTVLNPAPNRLVVIVDFANASAPFFVPANNQIQLIGNNVTIRSPFGRITDVFDPDFPVGYTIANAPMGMSLAVFQLVNNSLTLI